MDQANTSKVNVSAVVNLVIKKLHVGRNMESQEKR